MSEAFHSGVHQALLDRLTQAGLGAEQAQEAAASVLCALEQRLFGEGAKDPTVPHPWRLLQLLRRCRHHVGVPPHHIDRTEFLLMVARDLEVSPSEAEALTRCVFRAMGEQVSEAERRHVLAHLSVDLRELWPLEEAQPFVTKAARAPTAREPAGPDGGSPVPAR
ncbi:MAG: DUF2267 domain-containing protein [Myxococcota bacterium]